MSLNVISTTQDFPYLVMQAVHTPLLFQTGHIALKFSGDGHYQLFVVVSQRHGGTTPVLNEHQHSRRVGRGRDELVAQCLQSML